MANELQTRESQAVQESPAYVFTPAANIREREDALVLRLAMPGVTEQSVEVSIENDVLAVRGRVEAAPPANHRLAYHEYDSGDFRRVFSLSEGVDRERIEATVKDGILTLVLPKAEAARARRIPVKTA